MITQQYIYRGTRFTDGRFKGQVCEAVLQPNGKCVRNPRALFGRTNMLVRFHWGELCVVDARQLRKAGQAPAFNSAEEFHSLLRGTASHQSAW